MMYSYNALIPCTHMLHSYHALISSQSHFFHSICTRFVSHAYARKSTHAHTRERGWEGQGEGDRAKFEQERVRGRQMARGRGSVREREYARGNITREGILRAREYVLRISVTILRLSPASKLPYQSPCCCNTGVKGAIQTTHTVSIHERQDTVALNCLPHPPLN